MEQEKNEKVLAMYQAVYSLMKEGRDIHTMKVAEITEKAGIGKGTAYEYFRSKDELLLKALYYDLQMHCQMLTIRVKKQTDLKEALECCFDWLEEISDSGSFAMQLMKVTREHGGMCEYSLEQRENPAGEMVRTVLEHMIFIGKEKGIIKKELPEELVQVELLSKCLAYYTYTLPDVFGKKAEKKQMRQFLYDSIQKSLGEENR